MMWRSTLILTLFLFGLSSLEAQYQTIAGGDGDFDDASNWDANGVPPDPLPAGSSVTISHAITLNIDFDANGSFRIVLGGSLTGNKTLKVNGSGTNNGTMSIKKFQVGPNDGTGTFTNNGEIALTGELHIDGTLINTSEITASKVKAHGGTFSGGGFIYASTVEFDDNEGGRPGKISDMKFCSTEGGSSAPSFTYKDGTGHSVNSADTYICDGSGAPDNYRLVMESDLAAEIALPVELSFFTATSKQAIVELVWSTATESNNKHFEVEFSTDGKQFKQLGVVKGAGTTYSEIHYKFEHKTPVKGINYYRLRQVDFDGTFEYSPLVTAEMDKKAVASYRLFPNPAQQSFSIHTPEGEVPNNISLINTLGQEIRLSGSLAENTFNLPNTLQKGTYIVRFDWGGETYFERIVVQ